MQFKCSECGDVFDVSSLRLMFTQRPGQFPRGVSRRGPGLNLPGSGDPTPIPAEKNCYCLKCPKCKKTSWLTPLEE